MGEGLVSNDDAIKLDDPRDRGEHVCILLIAQVSKSRGLPFIPAFGVAEFAASRRGRVLLVEREFVDVVSPFDHKRIPLFICGDATDIKRIHEMNGAGFADPYAVRVSNGILVTWLDSFRPFPNPSSPLLHSLQSPPPPPLAARRY